MKDKWEYVTKEEMINFIKNYPAPLTHDFYMDWHSWNDFRENRKWPESMIAMAFEMYDDKIYKIRKDYIL